MSMGEKKSKEIKDYLIPLTSNLYSASPDLLPSNRFPFSTHPHCLTEGYVWRVNLQLSSIAKIRFYTLCKLDTRSLRHTMNLNYFVAG